MDDNPATHLVTILNNTNPDTAGGTPAFLYTWGEGRADRVASEVVYYSRQELKEYLRSNRPFAVFDESYGEVFVGTGAGESKHMFPWTEDVMKACSTDIRTGIDMVIGLKFSEKVVAWCYTQTCAAGGIGYAKLTQEQTRDLGLCLFATYALENNASELEHQLLAIAETKEFQLPVKHIIGHINNILSVHNPSRMS